MLKLETQIFKVDIAIIVFLRLISCGRHLELDQIQMLISYTYMSKVPVKSPYR